MYIEETDTGTEKERCSVGNTTQTKDHSPNCLFNDPILNWSVPFKLKPLFTKSDIDWFIFIRTIKSCFENPLLFKYLSNFSHFFAALLNKSDID